MVVCGLVVKVINELKPDVVKIDDAGLGGGVTDRLNELRNEGLFTAEIVPVNVGTKPTTDDAATKFANLKAELHWALRERFQDGDIDIEADDELMSQLGSIRYSLDSRGRIKIESKEDMKSRGLPSPCDHRRSAALPNRISDASRRYREPAR